MTENEIKLTASDCERYISCFRQLTRADLSNASFDFCYAFFQTQIRGTPEATPQLLYEGCLTIGFYLASWGMYRKGDLKVKSILVFKSLIEDLINNPAEYCWGLDIDQLDCPNYIRKIEACKQRLSAIMNITNTSLDLLHEKIMLGIFGCVPAVDNYFGACLKDNHYFGATGRNKALPAAYNFYLRFKNLIDKYAREIHMLAFPGTPSQLTYPKAKIIDMIGWCAGKCSEKQCPGGTYRPAINNPIA